MNWKQIRTIIKTAEEFSEITKQQGKYRPIESSIKIDYKKKVLGVDTIVYSIEKDDNFLRISNVYDFNDTENIINESIKIFTHSKKDRKSLKLNYNRNTNSENNDSK